MQKEKERETETATNEVTIKEQVEEQLLQKSSSINTLTLSLSQTHTACTVNADHSNTLGIPHRNKCQQGKTVCLTEVEIYTQTTSELEQGLAVIRAEGLAPQVSILPVAAKQALESSCISVIL
jgi:hypothetical protein